MMVHSGNGDAGGVEMEIGRQQFVHGREDGNCILGCRVGGAGAVGFDGCHQRNAEPGLLQFAVNTKMIATKSPGSGYGYAQNGSTRYFAAPFSFNSGQAAAVEVKQLGYVFLRLCSGRTDEAGGGSGGAAYASRSGHKLE